MEEKDAGGPCIPPVLFRPPWRSFDPVRHGLEPSFRLTNFSEPRVVGWKVPQQALRKILEGLDLNGYAATSNCIAPRICIGLDCSVTPLRHVGLSLVQTTDLLYPVCDDPYLMGRIACAQVLSDLYAMGVAYCDNMLMLLAASQNMTSHECDVVLPLLIRGFKDCAYEVGVRVTGFQTIINPWVTIGGVASSVCLPSEIIVPDNAVAGDALVLTKPIGTMLAVMAHSWLDVPERWDRLKMFVTRDEVRKAHRRALEMMARPNRVAAGAMHRHNVHAATDVMGFGLIGHAEALARIQKNEVSFVVHNLPVIAKMAAVAKAFGDTDQLFHQGRLGEVSGGLLIVLPRQEAAKLCQDLEELDEILPLIIGIVEKGHRTARIINRPRVVELPMVDKVGQLW